ncbi:VOC family protein [Streptomyces monticola]|uniref:VOC family protein n=1 Tax=Streptomyces monticola TaxID=2666263 RepID=A0ABW2JLY1_9ACTN
MPNKGIEKVHAVICVTDFDAALDWYEALLGRGPDQEPMEGLAEWYLGGAGAIQVFRDPDRAGAGLLTLSVSDVDKYAAVLGSGGLDVAEPQDTEGGFRVTTLADPAGNTVTLAQRAAT